MSPKIDIRSPRNPSHRSLGQRSTVRIGRVRRVRKGDFQHITSSPRYPQSNGEAERKVKTVKEMLKKAEDPYLALLSYRTTPLSHGWSPSQTLMGRQLRSNVATVEARLLPEAVPRKELRVSDQRVREKQKEAYDRRHRVKELPELKEDQSVYVRIVRSMEELCPEP